MTYHQILHETRHMAARLPHSRVHEDIRVNLKAVSALLNESLSPGVLYIVLHSRAERAVVPGVREPAVYVASGEDKAPALAKVYNFFHRFFGVFHNALLIYTIQENMIKQYNKYVND